MSIEIKITDPAACTPDELRAVATLLTTLAGRAGPDSAAIAERMIEKAIKLAPPPTVIDPADNPATGMPLPAEAFAQSSAATSAALAIPDPSSVFGSSAAALPNVAPSTAGAPLPLTAPVAMPGISTGPAAPPMPVPPPVPMALTAAVPAPSGPPLAPVAGVEVDVTGLPWDHRIHAGERQKNKDGSWRTRRGVDAALVPVVEAELRRAMGGAPVGNAQPPTPSAPAFPPITNAGGAFNLTFPMILPRLSSGMMNAKFSQDQLTAALQSMSGGAITAVPALIHRPDLLPAVATWLDSVGA